MDSLPSEYIWRRVHSLAGLWLTLFLIEHLLTNSQAALMFGEDGRGFIDGANWIHSLPYITAIEIILLGVPFLVHIVWGIQRLRTANYNSFATDGSTPSLPMYSRNKAYTWQRITSYLLIIGVILHVYNMRFLHYPESAQLGSQKNYMVRVSLDPGLYTLAERLDFKLYHPSDVAEEKSKETPISTTNPQDLVEAQKIQQRDKWIQALTARPITEEEAIAVTKDFGTAELLVVRNNFKSWTMIILYTLFVIAAVYHAFNGLWTFLITWGVLLTNAAQKAMLHLATTLMILVGFLGLSAIWLTYWVNLKT